MSVSHLTDLEDLAVCLLHLDDTTDEVPEAGLSVGLVLAEELKAVCLWVWLTLGWDLAASNLILVEHALHTDTAWSRSCKVQTPSKSCTPRVEECERFWIKCSSSR